MTEPSFLQSITPEPEMALAFLDLWFSGVPDTSLISINKIQPTTPGSIPIVLPLSDIKGAIQSSGLNSLIWGNNDIVYDLYFSVATLKHPLAKNKRGGLKDVGRVPGVWIDLDVKDGSFSTQEEAIELLRHLPLVPTCIIATQAGGVQAYWKLDRPVDCETGRTLCTRWWALLSDLADPQSIDKLCDPSRVMRLPGSIRWPKKPSQPTAPYATFYTSDTTHTQQEVMDATELVWSEHVKRIEKVKSSVANARDAAHREVMENYSPETRWGKLMAISDVEDNFNETYAWDSLLTPLGWVNLGEDDEKRVLWSRPGDGVRKSATTDWPDSPNIMSLFSTAPDTGLADLHEGGILLTKYRVWVQLFWDGDEKSAIKSLLGI